MIEERGEVVFEQGDEVITMAGHTGEVVGIDKGFCGLIIEIGDGEYTDKKRCLADSIIKVEEPLPPDATDEQKEMWLEYHGESEDECERCADTGKIYQGPDYYPEAKIPCPDCSEDTDSAENAHTESGGSNCSRHGYSGESAKNWVDNIDSEKHAEKFEQAIEDYDCTEDDSYSGPRPEGDTWRTMLSTYVNGHHWGGYPVNPKQIGIEPDDDYSKAKTHEAVDSLIDYIDDLEQELEQVRQEEAMKQYGGNSLAVLSELAWVRRIKDDLKAELSDCREELDEVREELDEEHGRYLTLHLRVKELEEQKREAGEVLEEAKSGKTSPRNLGIFISEIDEILSNDRRRL